MVQRSSSCLHKLGSDTIYISYSFKGESQIGRRGQGRDKTKALDNTIDVMLLTNARGPLTSIQYHEQLAMCFHVVDFPGLTSHLAYQADFLALSIGP